MQCDLSNRANWFLVSKSSTCLQLQSVKWKKKKQIFVQFVRQYGVKSNKIVAELCKNWYWLKWHTTHWPRNGLIWTNQANTTELDVICCVNWNLLNSHLISWFQVCNRNALHSTMNTYFSVFLANANCEIWCSQWWLTDAYTLHV